MKFEYFFHFFHAQYQELKCYKVYVQEAVPKKVSNAI